MPVVNSSAPKPRFEIDPESSLTEHGFVVRRKLAEGLDPFLDELADVSGLEEIFDDKNLNLIGAREISARPELGVLTRAETEDAIKERVPSVHRDMAMGIKGAGLINLGEDRSSLIVVDFIVPSQEKVRAERFGMLEVIESLVPGIDFNWNKFNRISLRVGKLVTGNTAEQRQAVFRLGKSKLPKYVVLPPPVFRPRVREHEADKTMIDNDL